MFLHHEAEVTQKWLEGYRFNPIVITPIALLALFLIATPVDPVAVWGFFVALVVLAPFWLPVFLIPIFWITWMHYIRYMFWFGREKIVLEIQLPPEVTKSPLSMEVFLIAIFNTGSETTFLHRFWRGGFRPVWSLEIASNEGRIGYYIHGPQAWKPAVEARIYGQFPDAKVTEVDDYVNAIPHFNLDEYELWGGEYAKDRDKPGAQPIRTYIDFGLDKDPDTPEVRVDPMTNIIELLNNMGPGEYIWLQLIIRARGKDEWYGIYSQKDSFKLSAANRIQEIMAGAAQRAEKVLKASEIVEGKVNSLLTEGERDTIKAIEHSLTKHIYECGIRALYIAEKDKFKGVTGAFMFRLLEPFNSNLNRLGGTRGMVGFDYPWEDFHHIRENYIKRQLFFYYKHRAYFYVPYDQIPNFMTTEELATIWHFPGSDVKTPGLNRVPSRRGEAPPNLPTLPS